MKDFDWLMLIRYSKTIRASQTYI